MASKLLTSHGFAPGTTVEAFLSRQWVPGNPPSGSAAASAAVASDSTLTFTGLVEGGRYVAFAAGRGVRFEADGDVRPPAGVWDRVESLEASAQLAESRLGNIIQVAAPTGVAATDRAAIQTSMDGASVGDTVRLAYGSVYTVDSPGSTTTPSGGGTLYAYCLQIPNGVTLDINGSTLKLAAGVLATVVRAKSGANNVGLVGYPGTIDGNNNALVDASGYLVWFDTVNGLELDVRVANGVHGGVVLQACQKVRAPRIVVDTIAGVGVGMGNSGGPVSDSWFGYIEVRNVTQWTVQPLNFPGNPISGVMTDSHVDTCVCVSNEAGIKVDIGSTDWTWDSVTIKGGTSTSNSGLKFQGAGTGTPLRCHAAHVQSTGNGGQGLYFEQCTDCSVGTYIGDGNATGGTTPDMWINGTRDKIGLATIRNAGSSSVSLRATAVDYRIGTLTVRNPTVAANGVTDSGASGAIGQLLALDDQGAPKMDRGYRSNSANSVCHIGHADIRGATVTPITRTAGDKVTVGVLRTNATVDLEVQTLATDAAFTLTPGASSKHTIHTGVLTADRAVTLSTTGAVPGMKFKITRTGGGAFNLTNALKNLATNQWAEFVYDGAAWKLAAFGSL